MESQRRKDTSPELALRKALFIRGLRYRIHWPVPGRPRRTIDVAFPKARVAVFVDGCFWHGCPIHSVAPKNNGQWWERKLAANAARDEETNQSLAAAGWQVLRAWEHEDPTDVAVRVWGLVKGGDLQLGGNHLGHLLDHGNDD
ncbi:very short patch repair endonuclease [Propioniciclava sp. MC1595]|uniref:very short patch repair endonuclease n=1 Tax=Propioniciclava sp. MC1595 TaxID=2760308 RepID=UPI001CB79D56|nr:very short patch repair endonuclease [Propioniciclava sp. MC1595]